MIEQDLLRLQRRLDALEAHDQRLPPLLADYLALPELRGLWAASSIDESGDVMDFSGQGHTLTNNGTTPRAVYNDVTPYFDFNGSTQYLNRTVEAGFNITGALTLGGWFWADALPAAYRGVFGKWNDVTVNQRSYALYVNGAGSETLFGVSSDGTAATTASRSMISTGTWHFLAGRFTPSTEVALFVDGVKYVNVTSIPAAVFDSSAALQVPLITLGGSSAYLDGRAALFWLCADDLSDALIARLWQRGRGYFGV